MDNPEVKVEAPLIQTMLSEKGHELIVVENYKYRKYRVAKRSGETCWCCTKKNCLGKIFTKGKDLEITQFRGVHSHQPLSTAMINRQQINNAITLSARKFCNGGTRVNKRTRRIQIDKNILKTLGATDVKYIEKNASRAQNVRQSQIAALPNQTEAVMLLEVDGRMTNEDKSKSRDIDSNDFEYEDIKVFPALNMNFTETQLGFIGGGVMASTIVAGLTKTETFKPGQIWMSSATEESQKRLKKDFKVNTADNGTILSKCDIVILAVKPDKLDEALRQASENFNRDKDRHFFVISVMSGVTLQSLKGKLQRFKPIQVIRTMPNTLLQVSKGIIVYSYDNESRVSSIFESEYEDKLITSIFSPLGIAEKVPEKLINAIAALAGSGPAYVYLMIEALSDGAVRMGVPREMAMRFASQLMIGAGHMVLETGKHPGHLKDDVCSPNGTTITGIHALERGGVRGHLMNAVEAATRRADEVSKLMN